ncbi:hypothetical protein P7C70_g8789, partial [Phenoliferia sp. Uapishka_3]
MAKFTHLHRVIPEQDEGDDTGSMTGAVSESIPFEMDDWTDKAQAAVYESKGEGNPDEAYQRLYGDKKEIDVSILSPKQITTECGEDETITELGLRPDDSRTTVSGKSCNELITDLGALVEKCVFTANLVELVNPKESFDMDKDWPDHGDDNLSETGDFNMDDDFYYSMTEGMKHVHLDSGNEASRAEYDKEESANSYTASESKLTDEPIFIEGKWQTFKLDSDMSESE